MTRFMPPVIGDRSMDSPSTRPPRRRLWLGGVLVFVGASIALVAWGLDWSPEASRRAIEDSIDRRRWVEAEVLLTRWVKQHPDDDRAWLKLGSVLGILRRDDEARTAFRRVRADDPAWVRAQILLGDLATKRHDAAEAERAYRGAAERDPTAILP